MPAGNFKNLIYQTLLPVAGKRCQWKVDGQKAPKIKRLQSALHQRRVVGACVQRFEKGRLTENCAVGYARLGMDKLAVSSDTIFRTASIAKMVSALLVFRLQTLGKLDVCEEVSDFLGFRVCNPRFSKAPITLGMLLNHTSSVIDHPAYFASFSKPGGLERLLSSPEAYSDNLPGLSFRYSNFGAGVIGSMLEKRFNESYETLAQKELFEPLGIEATFDMRKLDAARLADNYRVFPAACGFDAAKRIEAAPVLDEPDPDSRYLLASGNLYLTSEMLARLALVAWDGANGFIQPECLALLQTPTVDWPRKEVHMRYGMGLLMLEDDAVCQKKLWGHQGFAYGAVNGLFFDADGSGFVSLNSGASEQRCGHLATLNRDLIHLLC